MMKTGKIKLISFVMLFSLLFCSCAPKEEIPELLEPAGTIPMFRPVERVDMGICKVMKGTVCGKEYCHFYEKSIPIKSINVEVGQYVNEGEVLAEADTDAVKKQISELNSQLNLMNKENEINKKIEELDLKNLEQQKLVAEYEKNMGRGSEDSVKSAQNSIDMAEENSEFNQLMYDFNKRQITETVNELNKVVEEGILKAKKSGYVTYVKDLRNGMQCSANENVVIVTDTEDLYIAGSQDIRTYQYRKYAVKNAFIKGKQVPITEYDYTDSEVAFSKAQNLSPVIRFVPVEGEDVELTIGEFVIMQFFFNDGMDRLVVGSDSILTDDQGKFVYVKCEDGSLEKRYFEEGITAAHYSEVLSGLSEGELVMYTTESNPPEMKDEYTVELGKYKFETESKGVKYVEKSTFSYLSPDSGEVVEIYVNGDDEVKKGDPLLKIAVDPERGKLVSVENQIKDENRDFEAYENDYKDQYKNIHDAINEMTGQANQFRADLDAVKKALAATSPSDASYMGLASQKSQLEDAINILENGAPFQDGIAGLKIQLEKIDLEREIRSMQHDAQIKSLNNLLAETRKENDASGFKTVYADRDGVISKVIVLEGQKVQASDKLIESAFYFDDVVKLSGKTKLPYGYDLDVKVKDEVYDGYVIAGNLNVYPYIFTENGKVKYTTPVMDAHSYYVRISGDSFFNYNFTDLTTTYEDFSVNDVLIVPGDYVYEEITFDKQNKYNYVWVKRGDEVFKKYIQTGEDYEVGSKLVQIIVNGLSEGDVLVK